MAFELSADYKTIAVTCDGPIVRLTLNRPERRNPIDPATCGELVDALKKIGASAEARVVVITGAGKVFSAGGDLGQMSAKPKVPGGESGAQEYHASLVDLFTTMHVLGKPIIGMVGGHALAGGMGLAVACDLVIANEEAEFGTTEINVGLWPMMITAEIVRSIGRKHALEMMLTGRRVKSQEALQIGLINRIVPAAKLEQETMTLAQELADKSPVALRMGLKSFYATQDQAHEDALEYLQGQLAEILGTEDAREGITAFLEKRKPVWKGR